MRYVQVAFPWRAAFDPHVPAIARFYVRLANQTMRYGMPARRPRPIGVVAARGVPERPVATALRLLPRRRRDDIDAVLRTVAEHWEDLRAADGTLPVACPELRALCLERSVGPTMFLFSYDHAPMLVAKSSGPQALKLRAEVDALQRARPAGVAPAYLGDLGGIHVQRALPGRPIGIVAIGPEEAGELGFSREMDMLGTAMVRLCSTTVNPVPIDELRPWVDRTLGELSGRTALRVKAALKDVEGKAWSVLRHSDLSAQNCLFHEGLFVGLVDWEWAKARGVPGFDALDAAVAYMEHCLGVRQWSDAVVIEVFRRAWRDSPFFSEWRTVAQTMADVGEYGALHEAIEVLFFARRAGRVLERPEGYAYGPRVALDMLETVCAP